MTYEQVEKKIAKKEAEVEALNKKFSSNPEGIEEQIYSLYDDIEILQLDLVSLESERVYKPSDSVLAPKKVIKRVSKPSSSRGITWTLESIIEEASKHKSLSDWNRYSYSSYSNAKKMGIFDQVKKQVF